MIVDKNVLLKISSTNFVYYKTKDYEFKKGDTIIIDVKDLQFGTGVKVNVKCDICEKENKIYLQKYNMNKEKYGIYTCRKCSKFKRIKTTMERYGVDNASKCIDIKNKKKLTTLKNYGVENPSQSKIIKEQKKKTMLKNYGVEYTLQSKELVENIKNTKISKYGDENYNNRNKSLNTCMEKYGVENPSQLESIKKKKCKTSMKNYGVEYPSKLNSMKNKSKQTCMKKYGVDSYSKTKEFNEKCKNTCLEQYGVIHYSMTDECKRKTIKTNLKKYGVKYPLQNINIFTKQQKTSYKFHKYENLSYQSNYEKDFLNCYFNRISLSKVSPIPYFYENKKKYYYPDFYYKPLNLIIEIKSNYTYNKELDKNLSKRKSCIEKGYKFIFIIDKKYDDFEKLI